MQFIKETVDNVWKKSEEVIDTVLKVPESVRLVKLATNSEPWGPAGTLMRQISDLTFSFGDYNLVMQAIWEKLNDNTGANWRSTYKALLLLDYIIKNGSERVVNDSRQNIFQLKSLVRFQHIDENGVDRGLSVRERSKIISDLLSDTEKLREERKKAKINRDKYNTSISNESRGLSFDDDYGYGLSSSASRRRASHSTTPSFVDDEFDRNREFDRDYEDNYEDRNAARRPRGNSRKEEKEKKEDQDEDWANFQSPPSQQTSTASWVSPPTPSLFPVSTPQVTSVGPQILGPPISSPIGPTIGAPSIGSNLTLGGPALVGSALGGPALVGSALGGPALGGPALGGSALGGPTLGGPALGGPALGGSALGGPTIGGPAIGGPSLGGSVIGGPLIGGQAIGGSSLGGSTLGGQGSGSSIGSIFSSSTTVSGSGGASSLAGPSIGNTSNNKIFGSSTPHGTNTLSSLSSTTGTSNPTTQHHPPSSTHQPKIWDGHQHLVNLSSIDTKSTPTTQPTQGKTLSSTVGTGNIFNTAATAGVQTVNPGTPFGVGVPVAQNTAYGVPVGGYVQYGAGVGVYPVAGYYGGFPAAGY